nr:hypothetical protein [uncultured Draconibacterium sp.]
MMRQGESPIYKSEKEKIDALFSDYKKLATHEIDELILLMSENDYQIHEIDKLTQEVTKREKIRERAIKLPFRKYASWGFPCPVIKYTLNTKISYKQLVLITKSIENILFWKRDLTLGWFLNKSLTLVREYNIYRGRKDSNLIVSLYLDKHGDLAIKCKSRNKFLYDNEDNVRTLDMVLSVISDISKYEGLQISK